MNTLGNAQTLSMVFATISFLLIPSVHGQGKIHPDGHWINYDGHRVILVGDSGTQCVMQNLNVDYRRWIDNCAAAGLNAVHIWSFMGPRQQRDGKVIEPRYGYLYPGVTPWARRDSASPVANDGWSQWDLCRFDEGDDPNKHYWPRLRDLCRYAKQKHLIVGITVFFGWPKHNPSDWAYHPLNIINGGHLTDSHPIVEAVQRIEQPDREILNQAWSDSWPTERKTQYVWERFAAKLLKETQSFSNTVYVFMDERSYSEGNCGDHFNRFFKRRGAFWIDGQLRRETVDAVVTGHGPGRDINTTARIAFSHHPIRPFFEFELPPYRGAAVRRNLYACVLGGGSYFFHDDEQQETVTTGIMGYDPNVRDSRRAAVARRQRWLGIAGRILNQQVRDLSGMRPENERVSPTGNYCLARTGSEYVVYAATGGPIRLHVSNPAGTFRVTRINPRTGSRQVIVPDTQANELTIPLPQHSDWVAVIQQESILAEPPLAIDASFPGGNIIVDSIEGDTVKLHQDLRDTSSWWFWWNFRVRGAAGRTLRFQFAGASPIGVHGPAYSVDGGVSWSWLGADHVHGAGFSFAFGADVGAVRFAFAVPYQLADYKRFLEQHQRATQTGLLTPETLCTTDMGRDVPMLRVRQPGSNPPHRILLTARHHACETMASYVLEGLLDTALSHTDTGTSLRQNTEIVAVPMVDFDGVEEGDQGKNRRPRDHNRDYDKTSVHDETRAIRQLVEKWPPGSLLVAIDLHCPWIRGLHNESIYMVGSADEAIAWQQSRFADILQKSQTGSVIFDPADNVPFGTSWNTAANFTQGMSFSRWAGRQPGIQLATTFEIPYANAGGQAVTPATAREFGHDLAVALAQYLAGSAETSG